MAYFPSRFSFTMGAPGPSDGPPPLVDEGPPLPLTPRLAAQVAQILGLGAPPPFSPCVGGPLKQGEGGPHGSPPVGGPPACIPLSAGERELANSSAANESDASLEDPLGGPSGGPLGGLSSSIPSESSSMGAPEGPPVGVSASSLPSFTSAETESWPSPTQPLNPKP